MKFFKYIFILFLKISRLIFANEINKFPSLKSKIIKDPLSENKMATLNRDIIDNYSKIKADFQEITMELNKIKLFLESPPTILRDEKSLNTVDNQEKIINLQEIEKFSNLINNSLISIQNLEDIFDQQNYNLDDPNLFKENKNKHFDNSLLFYNSLSLIMLAMLTGGLIGVIFIMFFAFRADEKL